MFPKGPYKIVTVQLWKLNWVLCALVAVVVSLNIQVSQNKFLLGICKQSKLFISVIFACFKSHDFFSVGFLLSIYSHKAARHVCFCIFIRLAVAFYAAFISVARHRHYMSRFTYTSVEYSYGCGSNWMICVCCWQLRLLWDYFHLLAESVLADNRVVVPNFFFSRWLWSLKKEFIHWIQNTQIFFKGRDRTKRTIVCYHHFSFASSLNVMLSVNFCYFIVCFHNTAFALRVDFYFEFSLFQLAKILPTTTTEK